VSVDRGGAWWRRLGLVLAALLVAGALGEAVVRVALRHEWDTDLLRDRLGVFHLGTLSRFSDDAELYFELEPGKVTPFGRGLVATDAEGWRVPEDPSALTPQPAGGGPPVRLAVLGDSTCFGWRLAWALSYPERVRERLARRWRRPVELRNFCVPGYNAVQSARLLETAVDEWSPDLVLWHYDHNDAMPTVTPGSSAGMPPDHGDNALGSALVKVVLRRWREATSDAATDEALSDLVGGYVASGPPYERHLEALARAGDWSRRTGVPVLLVVFDSSLERRAEPGEHHRRLHAGLLPRLTDLGLAVLDLYGPYQRLMAERGWDDLKGFWLSTESPVDAHPNRFGHRFIGDTVADWILSLPAVPDGLPAPDS